MHCFMKAHKAKVSNKQKASPSINPVPVFTLRYETPDGEESRRLEKPTIESVMSAIRRCGVDVSTHFANKAISKKKYGLMTLAHPFRQRHLSCQYSSPEELLALLKGELDFLQSINWASEVLEVQSSNRASEVQQPGTSEK